jgi:hypothetical protein
MNKLYTQEEVPQTSSFSSLDVSKPPRDISPQTNNPIHKTSHDKKHANSIKPYRPKKIMNNTPSPLGHR